MAGFQVRLYASYRDLLPNSSGGEGRQALASGWMRCGVEVLCRDSGGEQRLPSLDVERQYDEYASLSMWTPVEANES